MKRHPRKLKCQGRYSPRPRSKSRSSPGPSSAGPWRAKSTLMEILTRGDRKVHRQRRTAHHPRRQGVRVERDESPGHPRKWRPWMAPSRRGDRLWGRASGGPYPIANNGRRASTGRGRTPGQTVDNSESQLLGICNVKRAVDDDPLAQTNPRPSSGPGYAPSPGPPARRPWRRSAHDGMWFSPTPYLRSRMAFSTSAWRR